jgi:hypothetical protein
MKKYAATITSLTVMVLLSQTNLFNDILMFLLVGAVPGTTHSISPTGMLLLVGVASWGLLLQFKFVRTALRLAFGKLRAFYTARKQNITQPQLGEA